MDEAADLRVWSINEWSTDSIGAVAPPSEGGVYEFNPDAMHTEAAISVVAGLTGDWSAKRATLEKALELVGWAEQASRSNKDK